MLGMYLLGLPAAEQDSTHDQSDGEDLSDQMDDSMGHTMNAFEFWWPQLNQEYLGFSSHETNSVDLEITVEASIIGGLASLLDDGQPLGFSG